MGDNWSKNSSVIFERFAAGIDDAISKGEKLECADRDLQYGIELQNRRILGHGLTYQYDLTPRGYSADGFGLGSHWSDGRYENRLEVRSCLKQEKVCRGGSVLFKKKQNAKLFQTVTDVKNPQNVADDDYVCPDCGAVTKIRNLLEGCPYCQNKFRMDELYPKISNYYFYPDVGGTRGELAKLAIPTILICIVLLFLPFLLFGGVLLLVSALTAAGNPYQSMQNFGDGIGILFVGVFIALFGGVIGGWIVTSLIYMIRLGKFSAQRIPMAKYLGCQKQFEEFMKQSTPEFSYEIFAGKAVSMIKMLIFSDNPESLPFYNGKPLNPSFRDMIDVMSMGCVGITKMETVGGYVYIHADVYLENTYDMDGKVKRYQEVFRVVMKKNLSVPVNLNFRITSIHCPTCAGSFDATKNKICPYCGNAYRMEDLDWSVEYLGRL